MPHSRTGLIVYDGSLRISYCNSSARDLLGESAHVGAHRSEVEPGEAVQPDPIRQGLFPSSHCRTLPTPDGPVTFLLNYKTKGHHIMVRFEPLEWTVGFVDQLSDFVLASSPCGVVLYANTKLGERVGIPSLRLVGMTVPTLAGFGGLDPAVIEEMARGALSGRSLANDFSLLRRAGRVMHLTVSSAPLRYCGDICGVLWTAHETVSSESRDAQALSAMWYRMAAIYQHELRNPLQTAQAAVAVARLRDNGACTDLHDILDQAIRSMSEILADHLQPAAGSPAPLCRLSDVASREIGRATLRFGTHLLTFAHAAPPLEPRIRCHMTAMGRVFANLFDNVGNVCPKARVDMSYAWDDRTLTCSIHDDGPGFPPAVLHHGWLGDGQPTKHLGLALVIATVEAYGGTVRLSNRAEGGARVTICLPLAHRVVSD